MSAPPAIKTDHPLWRICSIIIFGLSWLIPFPFVSWGDAHGFPAILLFLPRASPCGDFSVVPELALFAAGSVPVSLMFGWPVHLLVAKVRATK